MHIKKALISVSDKTNLKNLVEFLSSWNIQIISTGGTAKYIRELGCDVTDISKITNFPEIMDGRVKTLHPKVHGGLLAVRDEPSHKKAMEDHSIEAIDLVVVNLYPFEETIAKGASYEIAIENIDIGGPSMIRSAAKNHHYVTILTDPCDYEEFIAAKGGDLEFRKKMAARAFARTAAYDMAIANWFGGEEKLLIAANLKQTLRYGENSQQKASLYTASANGIANATQIQGKELSYNNLNDADAAFEILSDFKEPTAVIVKHANPCGVAVGVDIYEAYKKAFEADNISAFGGIIALNQILDERTAELISQIFTEVIIAPAITDQAREILARKQNLRILLCKKARDERMVKSITGGFLVQDKDISYAQESELEFVTKIKPTEAQIKELLFANRVVKYVKSNAIVMTKNMATIGIGAGQMSRVESVRIAVSKAGDNAKGAALASDAFFPFADGVVIAAEAGVKAIIQPGGSVKDAEVIAAADEAGIAMVLSGIRHFRH